MGREQTGQGLHITIPGKPTAKHSTQVMAVKDSHLAPDAAESCALLDRLRLVNKGDALA